MSKEYKLVCLHCGKEFMDNGFLLECDGKHKPALLVTHYASEQLEINPYTEDMYRYQKWLPTLRTLPGGGRTITYQSKRLCRTTGLSNLWIAFNGYWPEKGASLATTTFKDLEAYTVLARLSQQYDGVLVVSSAGNTAAAFAHACSLNKLSCLIILPASGLPKMQFVEPLDSCVKIVSLTGLADYYDAILLANRVVQHQGFILEGGVKNVGRRDGLGTTLLSAVEVMEQLPDYYFQAVGSGAGGIAVHEAARKLVQDGRFGSHYPRLMLCQNMPFAPLYHAWKARQPCLIDFSKQEGKRQIGQIVAKVLSNQSPPYAVRGGVVDVLKESQGDMLVADNREVEQAMALFQETENIEIDPAAGVAFASLLKQIASGELDRHASVLLNITGGGWQRKHRDHEFVPVHVALEIAEHEQALDETIEKIRELF